ncbi:MAG TPA: hypothetical protein VGR28_10530 [Candidatus Thermoplasmatota archaeon]|jgi:hypothetical protein|nr:hypothetical protein [Candidatus Thermoplasmatota archaeon]
MRILLAVTCAALALAPSASAVVTAVAAGVAGAAQCDGNVCAGQEIGQSGDCGGLAQPCALADPHVHCDLNHLCVDEPCPDASARACWLGQMLPLVDNEDAFRVALAAAPSVQFTLLQWPALPEAVPRVLPDDELCVYDPGGALFERPVGLGGTEVVVAPGKAGAWTVLVRVAQAPLAEPGCPPLLFDASDAPAAPLLGGPTTENTHGICYPACAALSALGYAVGVS